METNYVVTSNSAPFKRCFNPENTINVSKSNASSHFGSYANLQVIHITYTSTYDVQLKFASGEVTRM